MDVDALITQELTAAVERNLKEVVKLRTAARKNLEEADKLESRSHKMRDCDAAKKHNFENVPGSGGMGSRFEEKCSRCGWVHTC